MLNIISSVFKYSVLVIVILVVSQIVQIRGVSIAHHVENALNWVGAISPGQEVYKVKREISSAIENRFNQADRVEKIDSSHIDSEVSPTDEHQLNQVIRQSKRR